MDNKKKARLARKTTQALILQLKKDLKSLSKKDEFKAEILDKIIKEAESRFGGRSWELPLEIILESIYKYEIPLRETAKALYKHALELYDRPDWNMRGHDYFGDIHEKLLEIYGVGKE